MFPAESQKSDHEVVEIAVQHGLDVAGLVPAAKVLYELVRRKHIRADLASPGDVAQGPRQGLELLSPLGALALCELGRKDLKGFRLVLMLAALVLA